MNWSESKWTSVDLLLTEESKRAHLSQPALNLCTHTARQRLHPTLQLCAHRYSSAKKLVSFKHPFSLSLSVFLFSAALNNTAFKNDFKCLFLEVIIAFICGGLCRALRTNPARIWDNKTPSFSSYCCDVTLAARQSLRLGEVWDFVIRSMCVVSSWILTGTNNMMCDHGEMERRGAAALWVSPEKCNWPRGPVSIQTPVDSS